MSPGVRRRFGLVLLVGSLLGIMGFVGWDAYRYVAQSDSTDYLLQRCFFTLVTTVDIPMIQLALAGLILFRRRQEKDVAAAAPRSDEDAVRNSTNCESDTTSPFKRATSDSVETE